MKHKIFSAMQPTGPLHLGNYLGALKNWVELQNSGKYECFFGIVDLHAMTINYDPKQMPRHITDLAIDYLSVGVNPEKSLILIQSYIPEHTELCWILNCLTPMAELERMTQYKDKAREHKHNVNVGLFDYPVLQAADILLYKADTVPVGEDQVQHVEFSRLLARKFNNKFGKTFPEPRVLLTKSARLMSLVDPSKKMSKSYGDKHCLFLTDSPKDIKRKIASAVTDVGPPAGRGRARARPQACSADDKRTSVRSSSSPPASGQALATGCGQALACPPMSPGVKNLFNMLEVFTPVSIYKQLSAEYKKGTLKYVDLKTTLADTIVKHLKPIQEKRHELEHNQDKIAEILIEAAEKAQEIAEKTMREVREKVGIR